MQISYTSTGIVYWLQLLLHTFFEVNARLFKVVKLSISTGEHSCLAIFPIRDNSLSVRNIFSLKMYVQTQTSLMQMNLWATYSEKHLRI